MSEVVIKIGDAAKFSKTITETDVVLFAGISGDLNPFHVDDEASRDGPFNGRVAHGLLTSSLICTVLGMRLPGPGSIHLAQQLHFRAPVRPGDTITARVEVMEILPGRRVKLATTCRNQAGVIVVDGEAMVLAPEDRIAL